MSEAMYNLDEVVGHSAVDYNGSPSRISEPEPSTAPSGTKGNVRTLMNNGSSLESSFNSVDDDLKTMHRFIKNNNLKGAEAVKKTREVIKKLRKQWEYNVKILNAQLIGD